MTRRTKGPLRSAEAYAKRNAGPYEGDTPHGREIAHGLTAAWMAGYNSAIRARRKRDALPVTGEWIEERVRAILREILDERKGPK